MEKKKLENVASLLHSARVQGKPIPQLSKSMTPLTRSEAYSVQELQFQQRLRESKDRETQVGWKMGLTSEAKRKQMNLDSPLYGYLTNKMQVENDGTFHLKGSIHPKIEPEVAFLIEKDLRGNITRQQALEACEAICAALEILDSRYEEFKYFSMEDVIADNSSSSHFILGPWNYDFAKYDLTELSMQMSVDGKVVQKGISKDISGDPVISIVQLVELLETRGQYLKAGSIVLAGAATLAEALKPGQEVSLDVDHFQSVRVSIR